MQEDEERLRRAAKQWVRQHKKQLTKMFCDDSAYPREESPVTIFMAGTPGAGKTEFSKSLIETFDRKMVRIDADEIREMMREIGYNGKNSPIFQEAVTVAVSNLYHHVVNNGQSALLDGTFAYSNWRQNIEASLFKERIVELYYLYQEPEVAWRYVKRRENKQGRAVPREIFVHDYFASIKNVEDAIQKYGGKLAVNFARHDYENNKYDVIISVTNIASHIPKVYSKEQLESLIQENG